MREEEAKEKERNPIFKVRVKRTIRGSK